MPRYDNALKGNSDHVVRLMGRQLWGGGDAGDNGGVLEVAVRGRAAW